MTSEDDLAWRQYLDQQEREILELDTQIDSEDEGGPWDHVTRPPIPDMRFEQQFLQAVDALKDQNASQTEIFLYAVVKDQIIVPFFSGFTWSLGAHLWRWYRYRMTHQTSSSSNRPWFGFMSGTKEWLRTAFHSLVHVPSLVPPPS